MKNITYAIVLLMLAVAGPWKSLSAQTPLPAVKPVTSTEGCDFYVAFMPNGAATLTDKDLKLQLLVSSRKANKVHLEYSNGAGMDYNVPAGGTTVIDVDPKNVYWDEAKDEEEKVLDKGVRIYSVDKIPMTVYAVSQVGTQGSYSFDGAHVLPIEALGNEYIVQSANNDAIATEFVVMSTRPGKTVVNIDLAVRSRKGKERLTINFTKAKQMYIVRSKSADPNVPNDIMDLSGSVICADAPIAVWSGNQYAIIPNIDGLSTDHVVDQLLPVPKWGKEFIVPLMGLHMQMNEVHIISYEDNTNVALNGLRNGQRYTINKTLAAQEKWKKVLTAPLGGNLLDSILTIKADKPVQVYLYSSSGGYNQYNDDSGMRRLQGDPAMTMIAPLEYLTDTTIFSTYEAGDKQSKHQLVLWAKQSVLGSLQLDGAFIGGQFTKSVEGMPNYRYARIDIAPGTHTVVAAERGFCGYVYGVNDGQGYMYPAGYTFKPYQDSLFLHDPNQEYPVFRSEWSEEYLNNGGWYLDKEVQKKGPYILDSIRVCGSTELTFPIKMYNEWDHVKWEIIGSIRKNGYFTPEEQSSATTTKPELTHQFLLLPSEQNRQPFEDFEVRAVIYHKPLICDDSNPEKWPKDTLNTTIRVLRAYNDTTWKVICSGEELTFFRDSTPTGDWYETTFNYENHDVQNGKYRYKLGDNTITKSYISAGGCDSLSTLCLFVCPSYEETKRLSVCADNIYDVEKELGDYFHNVNFLQSYERKDPKSWTQQADGTWLFTGTSTLKARGCVNSADFEPYVGKVGNFAGCDSILNLELTVIPVEEHVTSIFECEEVYYWKDQNGNLLQTITYDPALHKKNQQYTFTKAITYSDCSACPTGGCDSVRHTLFLTFVDQGGIKKEIRLCQGEIRRFEQDRHVWEFDSEGKLCNKPYVQPAVTFTTPEGCTYDYIVTFIVDSVYNEQSDTLVYCWEKGDSFTYDWDKHTNFYVTQPNKRTYRLDLDESTVTFNQAGTYVLTDSLTTMRGCDSIWTQVVVLQPTYYHEASHLMSDEQWYEWEGRILAGNKAVVANPNNLPVEVYGAGKYTIMESLKTHPVAGHTCDSIRALVLQVGAVFRDTTYDAVCANCGAYEWVIKDPTTGKTKTVTLTDLPEKDETKEYQEKLKTVLGFDSIYVRYLTGYPNYEIQDAAVVCQGEDFVWEGHMQGHNGWEHNLYMNGQLISTIPTDRVGEFTIRDEMKTHEMVFTNPQTGEQKVIQCDSVHILTLRICKTYNHLYNTEEVTNHTSMKSNEAMTYFDGTMLFVGCDYDWQTSPYTLEEYRAQYSKVVVLQDVEYWLDSVQGTSQCGCDSMHYVNVHICKLKTTTLTEKIGDNNTTWQFGGDELDENGNRIHTHPLITGEKFHYYDDGTPVDYSANKDATVREYHFVDTLTTEFGCDSIVYANIYVYPTYLFEEDTIVCSNQNLDWRKYKELNHKNSGLWYDSLHTRQGFDSVYVLDLTLVATYEEHANIALCKNDTIVVQDYKIYYEEDKFKNQIVLRYEKQNPEYGKVGCDSIYYINMTYNEAYGYVGSKDYKSWVDTAYVCRYEEYKWFDKYGKEHTENLRDSLGNHYSKVPTDTVGWITIYDSLKTKDCNCDSIYTLKLYVGEGFRSDTTIYACSNEEVKWDRWERADSIYTFNGEYDLYDTIPYRAQNGCDSSYYLHIHFDKHYDILETVHLCTDDKQFSWEDIVFDSLIMASKLWNEPYHETFVREYKTVLSGCDSIMRLDITIAPSHDSVWTDTICAGETYMFYGQELTSSGTYTIDQPNEWGCYTHIYLTLEVIAPTKFAITSEPVCVDEEGLANTYILRCAYDGEFAPVSYSIRYDDAAQAAGFQNQDSIPFPINSADKEGEEYLLHLPVPSFVNRYEYPRPGYYQAEVAFNNGVCQSDSMMTYPFEMVMRYPSWITQQHWNDAILIMDSTLNGGYVFSAYQWYRDGEILYGETRPYLFAPEWLEDGSEYTVALTREDDGVTVMTCPLVPNLDNVYDNSPTQTYISVVPTLVAKENPVVYILSPTNGSYKLYNSQGQLVTQGDYTPNEYNAGQVVLPNVSGVYVFHLVENTTMNTGTDLRRTVKVIVQ